MAVDSTSGATVRLFVRCGDLYQPPPDGTQWRVLDLAAELSATALPAAIAQVRRALRGHRSAQLLVAGPVALGVALGQALAHDPVAIDYVQLNQVTKEFEVWVTNRRNL